MIKPVVYINKGLGVLSRILGDVNLERVFLVTGSNSFVPVRDEIYSQLQDKTVEVFNKVDVNVGIEDIEKGIKIYNRFSPDIVLAIGGGGVIDLAKSIKILSAQKCALEQLVTGDSLIEDKSPISLIAMPTTAGTGSEATQFSVVYINKTKYSVSSKHMLPEYAIMDSQLVMSMPKYLAACTGFDALSQAVESYWSKNSTMESCEHARHSIRLILDNLDRSVNEAILVNRKAMVEAAHCAGKAINISRTTAPHALSYTLSAEFDMPHGHAVAATLGNTAVESFEIAGEDTKRRFEEIFTMFACNSVIEFNREWGQLMTSVGLKPNLAEFDVSEHDVDKISAGVNTERLSGHPVALTLENLKSIIRKSI